MRVTSVLRAQHLGWMFKKHWKVQGHRVPRDTGAENVLAAMGYEVKDASEVLKPKHEKIALDIPGILPKPVVHDETHPHWKSTPCHIFGDGNVPLEGVLQAQHLTKSIVIEGLPKNLEESLKNMKISSSVDKNIQNSILSSHVFDAEQQKLPIVKVPERPMYVLPRTYGITHPRRNRLLISKLIFESEKLAGKSVNSQRKIVNNADFMLTLNKSGQTIQFDLGVETLITSKKAIGGVKEKIEGEIPELFPIRETISIPRGNIYLERDYYPIKSSLYGNPHTIFIHFSEEEVKNLHETPITTSQFKSRNILKAFTVAASRARQVYGQIKDLPEPIVVQSIQTDGKTFQFGLLQLNTLNLEGTEGLKNYWFQLENMDLFKECGIRHGKPVLEGYNKDVFRVLSAFYNNC